MGKSIELNDKEFYQIVLSLEKRLKTDEKFDENSAKTIKKLMDKLYENGSNRSNPRVLLDPLFDFK